MKRPLALVVLVAVVLAAFLVLVFRGEKGPEYDPDKTLRIPLNDNPKSLDPVRATGPYADGVVKRVFNGLVRHAPDLSIAPDLAESWTTSADGKTYTFKLRKGAKFQNGRELVADDVVYSLTRLADPRVSRKRELVVDVVGAVEYAEMAKGKETGNLPKKLSGLSAPDAHTVQIRLRRPWPPFLHLLTMSPASVVPREEVERLGKDFARMPVGTGPFRLVGYKPDDRIVLERFDGHFAGRPALVAIIYHIIDDSSVRLQSYLNGELDMTDIPLGRLPEFSSRPDHHSWAELDTYYLGISQLKAPYGKNVQLRRALNYAIDRKRLCERVLEGRAVPAKGVLPPGMPGYDAKRKGFSFDLEAARRELAAAGYPGGKGLPAVPLYHKPGSDAKAIVVELQQQLARAGIAVELNPVDLPRIKEMTIKGPPPLFFLSWIGDYPDPENFLYVLFHSARKGPTNRVHYDSPETDRLLKHARSLPAGPGRLAAYGRVEERVVADAPWVFLYHRSAHLLINPRVRGLSFTTLDTGTELPQADFVKVRKVKEE